MRKKISKVAYDSVRKEYPQYFFYIEKFREWFGADVVWRCVLEWRDIDSIEYDDDNQYFALRSHMYSRIYPAELFTKEEAKKQFKKDFDLEIKRMHKCIDQETKKKHTAIFKMPLLKKYK